MEEKKCSLTFYGHNCYIVESVNIFLAIDPWLDKSGAFFGSWFQYPKNHHLQEKFLELTNRKQGFVFLTHEHEDHFDLNTLKWMKKNTKIIIPNYKDKFMFNKLKAINFSPIELNDSQILELGDSIEIKIFISDVGINHDSALLVETNEFSFFNQNDCKIFDRLDEIKKPITYYSVQFSGATSYPISYVNYTDEKRLDVTRAKVEAKIKNVIAGVKKLNPKFCLPAAGPAIFPYLDQNFSLGTENIFIHQDFLDRRLNAEGVSNCLYPLPGELVSEDKKEPIGPPTLEDITIYRQGLNCSWESMDIPFSKDKLVESISMRLDQIWDLEFQCEYIVCFKWGLGPNDKIFIDLQNKRVFDEEPSPNVGLYTVEADEKYFALMHNNFRWQDISLSLRSKLRRVPDIFNNYVNIFLFSDVSNIRNAIESSLLIPKERIIIRGADKCIYEIDRYCPHQGADLVNAEVDKDNKLICPRHSWRFSLGESGMCTSNKTTISSIRLNKLL